MWFVTYYAKATGVMWFAVRSRKHITPWCMSPFSAVVDWLKGEVYEAKE